MQSVTATAVISAAAAVAVVVVSYCQQLLIVLRVGLLAVAAPRHLCHQPHNCSSLRPAVVKTTTTHVAMTTQVSTSVLSCVS